MNSSEEPSLKNLGSALAFPLKCVLTEKVDYLSIFDQMYEASNTKTRCLHVSIYSDNI